MEQKQEGTQAGCAACSVCFGMAEQFALDVLHLLCSYELVA